MTTQYKKTITPADVLKNGNTVTINRTTNAIRDQLQMLLGPLSPIGNVTVEISIEQLTDAGGNPLMTRGADNE